MPRFRHIFTIHISAAILAGCSPKEETAEKQKQSAAPEATPTVQESQPVSLARIREAGTKIKPAQWLELLEKTPDVRERAEIMELCGPFLAELAAPVIRKGIKDPAPEVRLESVRAAQQTYERLNLDDILIAGIVDADGNVRKMALDSIRDFDQQRHLDLFSKGLAAAMHEDAKRACILGLGRLNTKDGLDAIMRAIPNLDEKSAGVAMDAANQLLTKTFKAPAEATTWWASNHGNYDANLHPLR